MIESLLKAFEAGLSLWNTKESRKYLDELIELKQEWHDVYNTDPIDDDTLTRIELRMRILADSFASEVGAENSENK